MYKSYFRSYARKHNEGSLDRGKLIPQANFFSHFFEGNHNGKFEVRVKMIDGADNVFSLRRRKELFWQYRHVKLLGIEIDNKLRFNKHVETLCDKTNRKVSAFRRLNVYLSREQAMKLCNTVIISLKL